VRVRTKGAMLMLTLVALWATLPALACLTPPAVHACCRHVMHDCESSMRMSTVSCCDAHSSDSSVPPAQASRAQAIDLLAHAYVTAGVTVDALDGFRIARTAETPPGLAPSSHTSVLRI
jgi:hypothetical protein